MINTITQEIQIHNKYNYTTSLKNDNYIYGIDNRKGLANGVRRKITEKAFLYLITFSLTINLTLYSNHFICIVNSFLFILSLPNYNINCKISELWLFFPNKNLNYKIVF